MSFADVLDILLVAIFLFLAIRWIKGSAAFNIFLAIIFILVARIVADALNMKLTTSILNAFIDLGVIAVVVIFQPEIRRFLVKVGNSERLRSGREFINRILGIEEERFAQSTINEITEACRSMSEEKTGALIVIPHKTEIKDIIETGDEIDAKVSRRLIMNIFFKNSPLHDGAMIISGDRIVAARCTLPNTDKTDIPAHYGMRHKAAIGMTENSDADVIVVSEETGAISIGNAGKITRIGNINELKLFLNASAEKDAEEKEQDENAQKRRYTEEQEIN